MELQKGTAIVDADEYVALKQLKADEGKALAAKEAELDAKVEKIRWGSRSFTISFGGGYVVSEYEYIGKDEAIKRLTDKLNAAELAAVPRPEPKPANFGTRLKFLFTGKVA